jgi:hypothetical protein
VAKFLFITWTMTCVLWFIICTVQDSHDRLEDCLSVQGNVIDAALLKECLK